MRRTLLLVLLLMAATMAIPAVAQSQIWTGPAALEVRAEDSGKPAAGGEVRLNGTSGANTVTYQISTNPTAAEDVAVSRGAGRASQSATGCS